MIDEGSGTHEASRYFLVPKETALAPSQQRFAREVDPAALGDPELYRRWRQETDRFWQQHAG